MARQMVRGYKVIIADMQESENPLVSVGIPFYNNANHLEAAIRSVLNQDYEHLELILVDDGSSDGSLDIASRFSDPRIRIVSDGENQGLPKRLNQLTALSSGQYIARMDADDIMVRNRIRKQVQFFEHYPDTDVVGTAAYLLSEDTETIGIFEQGPLPSSLLELLWRGGLWAHPTIMGRKIWFTENPYNTLDAYRKAQDLELWCRTISKSNFRKLDEPLLFYRINHTGETRKYWQTLSVERRIIKEYGSGVLPSRALTYLLFRAWARTTRITIGQQLGIRRVAARLKRRFANTTEERSAISKLQEALIEP